MISRHEEYEDYANQFEAILAFTAPINNKPKKITKTRNVVSSFEMTWADLPFWRIELSLNTKFPNIPTYKLNLLYLFSRLDIRIFYSFDEEWPTPGNIGSKIIFGEWKSLTIRLRLLKENPECIHLIYEDFTSSVIKDLQKIAGVQIDQPLEIANSTASINENN